MIQCMGGFCRQRESCAHYHAPQLPGREPAGRLCERGHDQPERIRAYRERLAADPRFALWAAIQPAEAQP